MAKKSDSTTTEFEKMGDSLIDHLLNPSGQRNNPYTIMRPKGTQGRGKSPTGKSAIRGATMIHEANGPACTVKATLYKQNAAEASATMRNVRLMKSAVGDRDFRSRGMYRQGV